MEKPTKSIQPGFPELQQDMPTDLTWHKLEKQNQLLLGVRIKWYKCKDGFVNLGYGYDDIYTIAKTIYWPTTTFPISLFILNDAAYQASSPEVEVEPIWPK